MESIPNGNADNVGLQVDLSIFREHVKLSLLNILENLPKTPKTLVIDASCLKKLDFFTDFSVLEERGVKKGVIILSRTAISTETQNIVYVISPNTSCLEDILFQIQNHQKENLEKKYTVIFIPKITYDCQVFIDKMYLKAELNIQNLPIDLIPLEKDVMSLEANETIPELYLKGDTNILSVLSRAIIKFETVFGKIKYKYAKGDHAKTLKKILESEEEISPFESDNEILASIILDRSVDFITPMCSQYTYEGLIDEFLGITYNMIKVKPQILEKDGTNEIKVELSSKDKLYAKIRDYNFNYLRSYLPNKLEEHRKILAEGNSNTQNLQEISLLLEKVKIVKEESPLLATHINIADYISNILKHPFYKEYLRYEQSMLVGGDPPNFLSDFYENEMAKQSDLGKFLKLICLESIINNGLKGKYFDLFRRDFLNIYGYQEIFLLRNLEKLKILKKQEQKPYYEYINENLILIKEEVNIIDPDDCSYVFGGYCPISIRLIEAAVKKGWGNIKEVLKRLPGEFEYPQNEREVISPKSRPNLILIVMVGGITYAEIAAIRFLNRSMKDHKFIILTTHILNSKKLIEGLRARYDTSLTMKDYFTQIRQLKGA